MQAIFLRVPCMNLEKSFGFFFSRHEWYFLLIAPNFLSRVDIEAYTSNREGYMMIRIN